MTNSEITINFAGHQIILDAAGVIYFPAEKALLVSDLHFEKGSFFAAKRSPVPLYDTVETLERLETAIKKYLPDQVICLGDSFHDLKAEFRIHEIDAIRLNNICANYNWVWILGNHDKNFPKNIHGHQVTKIKIGNINLSHERTRTKFEIIGHFHPKARITLHEHKISGKVFIMDNNLLVMPSFGSYTGGLYTHSPKIKELFQSKANQYLIYNNKLWRLK